jgi:uncharacterized protein YkvS
MNWESIYILKPILADLKPFLLSFSRCKIGDLISTDNILTNVIDGIVLNQEHTFTETYNDIGLKNSGVISWKKYNKKK